MSQSVACLLSFLCLVLVGPALCCVYHDYCVVGAGPAGLQLGYFLGKKGRDYVVFEKSSRPGSFFELYPRHRTLISINKRHTGQKNAEFNLRHDWNSLLSDDDELLFTKYTNEMFPHADVLLDYLDDYQRKLKINVQFNTKISDIHQEPNKMAPDGHVFKMKDQSGQCYTCRTLIMATGIATPNIPNVKGIELTKGYEDVSIDPKDYEGKTVLILGRGNAAFEVATGIYGSTNVVHMTSRSRARLAWSTHYVGDLRAVNNALLDTYQLKSLDGLSETPIEKMQFVKVGDKIQFVALEQEDAKLGRHDNVVFRQPYDVVIRSLGFTFDSSVFNNTEIARGKARAKKYPAINHNYESVSTKGLFYAGTCAHSLDFRKSAGGFIHGFRYTARVLHRLLEWRYEGVPWPTVTLPRTQLLPTILRRVNEASGPYQMSHMLGDVAVFSQDGKEVVYIEEFPIQLLHDLPQRTGINATSVLVTVLEYGKSFSGPAYDVFKKSRAVSDASDGHKSNFLHPVLYYYKSLPTEDMMKSKGKNETLPRPDMMHHFVEDFNTIWDASHAHILPLRRFLENIWNKDLRTFYSPGCFQIAMTHGGVPEQCDEQYLDGHGLYGTADQLLSTVSHGLMKMI